MKEEAANKVVSESLKNMATGWNPGHYRWVEDQRKATDPCASKFMRGRYIKLASYVRRSQLNKQEPKERAFHLDVNNVLPCSPLKTTL